MGVIKGDSSQAGVAAVEGVATAGDPTKAGPGVHARSTTVGVFAEGETWHGVHGSSSSTVGGVGVYGSHTGGGTGVVGESSGWHAVYGKSTSTSGGAGIWGDGIGTGVVGVSKTWHGVYGETESTTGGAGICGKGKNGARAGLFEGDVEVTGDIRLLNADIAEQLDIAGTTEAEPGTVMVLGEDGSLCPSSGPYDRRVVGVVSGAGSYKPGIVLDQRETGRERRPIALLGKVFCKVDAGFGAVAVGDLLTTSPTPGHAMKADDPARAFGAVIGKALRRLPEGQGLVPILIALQ